MVIQAEDCRTFSSVCSRQSLPTMSSRFTSSPSFRNLRAHSKSARATPADASSPCLCVSNSVLALFRITSRHVSPFSLRHTKSKEARSTWGGRVRPPRRRARRHAAASPLYTAPARPSEW